MKFCPNYGCVAYGRVVYTQSTRCVFCRWDLKPPRMKSETVEEPSLPTPKAEEAWDAPADAPTATETRSHHRRSTLRHTA